MAVTMERLSEIASVSGAEDNIRKLIIPEIRKNCDDLIVDTIGNVIAFKKGKSHAKKLMIATHIDEVGFIVSDITEKGFIKFKTVGTIDSRVLVSKKVKIGEDGILGVIGMKAIHLQTRDERDAAVKTKNLFIDIGETSKKDAEKKVKLGDRITFLTEFADMGDVIKGKSLDRMGIKVLLDAMDITPAFDTYFVFAAQREVEAAVMGRGMRVATHRINPDFALVINTLNTDDFMDAKRPSAKMGESVVIEYADRTSMSDLALTNAICNIADRNAIKYQRKTTAYGTSQAGAIETSAAGCVTATVALPCRYLRTPVGMMSKKDINAACDMVRAFMRESEVIVNGIIEETDRV